MCDVTLIIVMFKRHFKGESVVIATAFFLHGVLIVCYVLTVAVPAKPTSPIRILYRVKQRLLPLVVAGVWLHQINDIEFVLNVFAHVVDLEVKPLSVGRCLVIILQNQVVLILMPSVRIRLHYAP